MSNMDTEKLSEVRVGLKRIRDSVHFCTNSKLLNRNPDDKKLRAEFGYVTFLVRFQLFSAGVHKLLENITDENWDLYYPSIAIISRASMLDCLYVMAWDKRGDDIIYTLLADSIDNFKDNGYWETSDKVKEHLTFFSEYFSKKGSNKLSPKKLVSIIGPLSEPFYRLYDLYSKVDHFSIMDTLFFKTTNTEQLKFIGNSVDLVVIILQMLFKKFESEEDVANLLEILKPSQADK